METFECVWCTGLPMFTLIVNITVFFRWYTFWYAFTFSYSLYRIFLSRRLWGSMYSIFTDGSSAQGDTVAMYFVYDRRLLFVARIALLFNSTYKEDKSLDLWRIVSFIEFSHTLFISIWYDIGCVIFLAFIVCLCLFAYEHYFWRHRNCTCSLFTDVDTVVFISDDFLQ